MRYRSSNAITRFKEIEATFIEQAVTKGLPYLDAEAANKEVIRLTLDLMRLQAKLDAARINLWDEKIQEDPPCG